MDTNIKTKNTKDLKKPSFVGQKDLFQNLTGIVQNACNGIPAFVVLNGEEGTGKTRIAEELKKYVGENHYDFHFIEETCVDADDRRPFFRIVRTVFRFYKTFGKIPKENYVGKSVSTLNPEFIEFALAVYEEDTLENIFEDVESDPVKIAEAAANYFRSHSQNRTICLIFEDSHSIDRRSAEFLVHLAAGLSKGDRFIFLALYHGDESSGENNFQRTLPKMRQQQSFREIKIPFLLARSIFPFIRSMVGSLQLDDESITDIYRVTRGNPKHIEAMVQKLAEEQHIIWQDGSWVLQIDKDFLNKLPPEIEELLVRNYVKQGKNHKDILSWIAVADRPLNNDYISSTTGLSVAQLPYVLTDLTREKYLLEEDGIYSISSSKIAEEVLRHLAEKQVKKMHLKLGKISLKYSPEKEKLWLIAEHFIAGEDTKKALLYSLETADWAFENGKLPLALKYYRKALSLAETLRSNQQCEILTNLGFVLYRLGNTAKAESRFLKASKLVKENQLQQVARIEKGKGLCYFAGRNFAKALTSLRNAEKTLENDQEILLVQSSIELERHQFEKAKKYIDPLEETQINDTLLRALFLRNKGTLNFFSGNWQESKTCFDEACQLLENLQQNQELAETLLIYSQLSLYTEGISSAERMLEDSLALMKDNENWFSAFLAHYYIGMLHIEKSNAKESQAHFLKVQEISKKRGNEKIMGYSFLGIAHCYFHGNKQEQAEALAKKALENSNAVGNLYLASEAYFLLSKIYAKAKNLGLSQKYLDYSAQNWKRLQVTWKINRLRLEHARIFITAKHFQKATDFLEKAKEKAESVGDHYLLSDIYFEKGRILKVLGDPLSQEWFNKARELYQKLGRTRGIAKTETLLQ